MFTRAQVSRIRRSIMRGNGVPIEDVPAARHWGRAYVDRYTSLMTGNGLLTVAVFFGALRALSSGQKVLGSAVLVLLVLVVSANVYLRALMRRTRRWLEDHPAPD